MSDLTDYEKMTNIIANTPSPRAEQPPSSVLTKEQLAAMTPKDIARSLATTELAALGALSVVKHILECRGDDITHDAHNAWVCMMSDLGILKEFENG